MSLTAIEWMQKLSALRAYRDGWNRRGAPAPSEQAIAKAERLVELMVAAGPEPVRIAASAVGGVGVTCQAGGRMAYVEFSNDGTACALLVQDDQEGEIAPATDENSWPELLEKIRTHLDG